MTDQAKVRALLDEGLTHYGLGEVSKALEIWNKVLELDPSNVRAREYVRFVNENWAPQSGPDDGSYRPDEETDPNRVQEDKPQALEPNEQSSKVAAGGDSPPAVESEALRPEDVPLPDDSGFVPPVKPLANLWGDLYNFSGSDSSKDVDEASPMFSEQEPTVPAEIPAPPSVVSAADALFIGSEEPTVESSELAHKEGAWDDDGSGEIIELPAANIEQPKPAVAEGQSEQPPGLSPSSPPEVSDDVDETLPERPVEVIMSSTLPVRPAETEPVNAAPQPTQAAEPEPLDTARFPSLEPEVQSSAFENPPSGVDLSPEVLPGSPGQDISGEQGSKDEPDLSINPVPPFAGEDVLDEPSALSLVGMGEEESTEVESLSPEKDSRETMLKGARDLLESDDFSGALEILGKILEETPDNQEALDMRKEAEESLMAILTAKLGDMEQSPEVCMSSDEIIWLNLDNRAGFVLSLVDGNTSYEDILSLSGLERLAGMKILAQLVQDKVIQVT